MATILLSLGGRAPFRPPLNTPLGHVDLNKFVVVDDDDDD